MFKKFQTAYDSLPPCNPRLWPWPADENDFLATRALEVRGWGEARLAEGAFSKMRDDYRELCELIVYYLGGEVILPLIITNFDQILFIVRDIYISLT